MNESTGFPKFQSHEENLCRGRVYLKSFEHSTKNLVPYVNEAQSAEAAHAQALHEVKASESGLLGIHDESTAAQQEAKDKKHRVTLQGSNAFPKSTRGCRARVDTLVPPPRLPVEVEGSLPKSFDAQAILPAAVDAAKPSREKRAEVEEAHFIVHLKDLNGRRRHQPLAVSAGELAMSERCPHLLANGTCSEGTCYVLDCAAYDDVNIFGSTPVTADNITWDEEELVHFERGYLCDNEHCKGHRYPAGPRCWTRFGLYITDDIMACMSILVLRPKRHFTPLDHSDQRRLSAMVRTHFNRTTRFDRIWKPATYFYQPFEYALWGLKVTTWKRKGEFWDEEHEYWEGEPQEIVDWKQERIRHATPEMKRYLCYLARLERQWRDSGYRADLFCDAEAYFRNEFET